MNWLEKTEFSPQEVLKILPHRYPFLMIDKVLELKTSKPMKIGMTEEELMECAVGAYVVAVKNVTFNEMPFLGHFPNRPIFPGVLTVEAMAQSAAFITIPYLAAKNNGVLYQFDVALATFDDVRFRKLIVPGDQLIIKTVLHNFKRNIYSFRGEVTVEGQRVAEGKFMAQLVLKKEVYEF